MKSRSGAVHKASVQDVPAASAEGRAASGDAKPRAGRRTLRHIPELDGIRGIAALMVFGAISASDAFLKQQDVQSVCDGAALAAADRTDEGVVYARGVAGEGFEPS